MDRVNVRCCLTYNGNHLVDWCPICSTHGCYLRPHVSDTVYVLLIACLCLLLVDLLDLDWRLLIRFSDALGCTTWRGCCCCMLHLLLLRCKYFCSSLQRVQPSSLLCWLLNEASVCFACVLSGELCTMWHVTFGCNDSWVHRTHVLYHVKLLKINPNF